MVGPVFTPGAGAEQAGVCAHAIAGEARLAIRDVDGAAAQLQRLALGGEPAIHRLEKQPDVHERVDVLIRIGLVEREHVVGRVGRELGDPRSAVGGS